MRFKSILAAFLFACAPLCGTLAGCAAAGGTVTASAGRTQHIRVGTEVVVRLPATTSNREWRLTEFDSVKLPFTVRARLEPDPETGNNEWVARFIARAPGSANIIYTRVALARGAEGTVGERRTFRFQISE